MALAQTLTPFFARHKEYFRVLEIDFFGIKVNENIYNDMRKLIYKPYNLYSKSMQYIYSFRRI